MEKHNYHSNITANVTPQQAYANIANVGGWWAKSFKGSALKEGDTFTVTFGTTSVAFCISEAVPGKKVVWHVTDCYLPWLNDKTEWTNTDIVWELTAQDNATKIDMTHVGLVPGVECYEMCDKGWNGHIYDSLQQLLTKGTGKPA